MTAPRDREEDMPHTDRDQGQDKTLDVITIGRSSVDLYGQQLGTRLEDTASA
jgi:5-dehydro-2-deoxygluconokinase